MGMLEKIGVWAAANLPGIVKVVKKSSEIVHAAASYVDALLEGKEIVGNSPEQPKPADQRKKAGERPDIIGGGREELSRVAEIHQSIDLNKKQILTVKEENELEHRRIGLQIDVMELVVSSATFERFTNNICLHAANLQIHLQAIQNFSGLLHDVNNQRVGVKALIGTVNHLVNVLGVEDKVKKISGLHLDMVPGAISVKGMYDAYENTRVLLLNEIDSFLAAIEDQREKVERVRASARRVPDTGGKVSSWLADAVEPKLLEAKNTATELKGNLLVIPALETMIRRELEADIQ